MMTTDKARKRAVRSRMTKTGERYAAARRHVVDDARTTSAQPLPPRVADPGVSEEAIRKATGRGWDEWLRDLDTWDAVERSHTEIARHVAETYPISGWWAQSVTVGYERARGMRAIHQTSRGFEVSVSKTLALPPADVWPWVVNESQRDRWIDPGLLELASRRDGRWARLSVDGDDSSVRLSLDPKGADRSVLTVTHSRLHGSDDIPALRLAWRKRLETLERAMTETR
jgi:hypothetical protein